MQCRKIFYVLLIGVMIISVYNIVGNLLNHAYDINGNVVNTAYNIDGDVVFPDGIPIPIPSGDLTASETVALPDLYQIGKGFTCTGLSYDSTTDTYLVGDIGAMQPGESYHSRIIRMSTDFRTVEETIPLYEKIQTFGIVQGISFDSKRGTIWVVSTSEGLIRQVDSSGNPVSSFSSNVGSPTGIAYSADDDTLWLLTYNNKIVHYSIGGSVIASYDFAYGGTLDQCFLDEFRGLLYITADDSYTSRNNVYVFNVNTHEQYIACTVDSYSVEGIWLGDDDKMIIVNDGYYHAAAVPYNQANIYTIE